MYLERKGILFPFEGFGGPGKNNKLPKLLIFLIMADNMEMSPYTLRETTFVPQETIRDGKVGHI